MTICLNIYHGSFTSSDDIIHECYFWERDNPKYNAPPIRAEFNAKMDYTTVHLKEADFFDIFGIPVFSANCYMKLKDVLTEDPKINLSQFSMVRLVDRSFLIGN